MHKILFHRNAVKFYRKADDTLKERITNAIDVIARNPHVDSHIKRSKGILNICIVSESVIYVSFTRSMMHKKLFGSRPLNGEALPINDSPIDAIWVEACEGLTDHSITLMPTYSFLEESVRQF
jgi:hypothetical protein